MTHNTHKPVEPVMWTEPPQERAASVVWRHRFGVPVYADPWEAPPVNSTQAGTRRAPDNRAQEWTHR